MTYTTDWKYWEYGVIIRDETSPHNGMLLRTFRLLEAAESYATFDVKEEYVIKKRQVTKTPWKEL